MNQIILPSLNTIGFNTQSYFSLQPLNPDLITILHVFTDLVKDVRSLEKGNYSLFTGKQKTEIKHTVGDFLSRLNELNKQRILADVSFMLNPYVKVLFNESQLPMHQAYWQGQMPHMSLKEYVINLFNRLSESLIENKCALNFSSWMSELNTQTKEQKTKFDNLLKKEKETVCVFIELPMNTILTGSIDQTLEQVESSYPKTLKSFFKKCHQSECLKNKLCNIQWRFVKSLNGVPIAQALIYIVGDNADYNDVLNTYWNEVCVEKGLNLPNIYNRFQSIHCYQGNGLACKQWKFLIDSLQGPLHFYRYKGNGLTYVWKTYTGNI